MEPPDGITIYTPGGEVKAPVLIRRVEPEYPAVMQRSRMRALVVVRCVIDKFGRVRDPEIVVPAMAPFNQSVLDALREWRYTPGSRRGQAVETYLEVKVTFQLN
jgi:protein TonB